MQDRVNGKFVAVLGKYEQIEMLDGVYLKEQGSSGLLFHAEKYCAALDAVSKRSDDLFSEFGHPTQQPNETFSSYFLRAGKVSQGNSLFTIDPNTIVLTACDNNLLVVRAVVTPTDHPAATKGLIERMFGKNPTVGFDVRVKAGGEFVNGISLMKDITIITWDVCKL